MPAAVLIDLFDTFVQSNWRRWRDEIATMVGVDQRVVDEAFSLTRPARSVGAYADSEGDMAAVLLAMGFDPPPPDLARDLAAFEFGFLEDSIHVYPDSLPTLAALRDRGVRTALVSNCSHGTRSVVDRLGLDEAFDAVILSFEVRARKPQGAIYHAALDALGGVAPSDAIFVDDQTRYCAGARAAGLDTRLIIRTGAEPPEGISLDTNGHAVITTLADLL